MATLRLEIVTPEAKTYSEDVDMVTIPGADGEYGILPMHVPLITALQPGLLKVQKGGQELFLATGGGFAEVMPDRGLGAHGYGRTGRGRGRNGGAGRH